MIRGQIFETQFIIIQKTGQMVSPNKRTAYLSGFYAYFILCSMSVNSEKMQNLLKKSLRFFPGFSGSFFLRYFDRFCLNNELN